MTTYSSLFLRGVPYTPANKAGDTFTGQVNAPSFAWNQPHGLLNGDGSISNVIFDNAAQNFFQAKHATGELWYYGKSASNIYSGVNGELVARGWMTGTSFYTSDGSVNLTTNSSYTTLYVNTSTCYISYAKANGSFDFVVNSALIARFTPNGNLMLQGTTLNMGADAYLYWDAPNKATYIQFSYANSVQLNYISSQNRMNFAFAGTNQAYITNVGAFWCNGNINTQAAIGAVGFIQTNTAFYVGPSFRFAIVADEPNGFSDIIMDNAQNYRLRYNWTTGVLYWLAGGVAVMRIDPNGNLVIKGSLYYQTSPLEGPPVEPHQAPLPNPPPSIDREAPPPIKPVLQTLPAGLPPWVDPAPIIARSRAAPEPVMGIA